MMTTKRPNVPKMISRVIAVVPQWARRMGFQTFLERVSVPVTIEWNNHETFVTFSYTEDNYSNIVRRMAFNLAGHFPIPVYLIVEYSKEYQEYCRWPDHIPTFKVIRGKVDGITRSSKLFSKSAKYITTVHGNEIDTTYPSYDKVMEMAAKILNRRTESDKVLEEYITSITEEGSSDETS